MKYSLAEAIHILKCSVVESCMTMADVYAVYEVECYLLNKCFTKIIIVFYLTKFLLKQVFAQKYHIYVFLGRL